MKVTAWIYFFTFFGTDTNFLSLMVKVAFKSDHIVFFTVHFTVLSSECTNLFLLSVQNIPEMAVLLQG